MVEEIGGLALLIALEVGVDVGDEGLEGFGKVCHAADDRRAGGCGKEKGKGGLQDSQAPKPRQNVPFFGGKGSWLGGHWVMEDPP